MSAQGSGYVNSVPIKRRPRFANGRAYVDKATKSDEAAIRAAYSGPKFTGPVGLRVLAFKPLKSVKRGEQRPFIEKPDTDNIAKAVMDGLNGVAYDDDAQVVELHVKKLPRSREPQEPFCTFYVYPIEGGSNA